MSALSCHSCILKYSLKNSTVWYAPISNYTGISPLLSGQNVWLLSMLSKPMKVTTAMIWINSKIMWVFELIKQIWICCFALLVIIGIKL